VKENTMRRTIPVLIALGWLGACGGEPPQEEAVPEGPTRADSVELASAAFDATVLDTISWETEQEAVERGGLVYRISCSKCHGDGGRGNGNFVVQGDTLRPPSFLEADWRFADDPLGLRAAIFSGNVAGMPYWGLVGLKYRDIDAVAIYIHSFLRPNYGGGM
jgi:mono/diheme cytochrome c family protein